MRLGVRPGHARFQENLHVLRVRGAEEHEEPDRSRLLQGATLGIAPKQKTKEWADKAPDITSGGLAG